MNILQRTAAALAAMAGLAQAQPGSPPPPPPVARILIDIGVDDARAQKVAAIFQNSHARAVEARHQIGRPTDDTTRATLRAAMEAIRSDTDRQLAEILSAEEITQLRAAMPPRRHGPPPEAPA